MTSYELRQIVNPNGLRANQTVVIRAPQVVKDAITAASEKAECSVAEWCRRVCVRQLIADGHLPE